ncbi:MAG: copper chaperone PCu(A)C [Planctomycetota bacterium]|jgi:copper(I)-binding protein
MRRTLLLSILLGTLAGVSCSGNSKTTTETAGVSVTGVWARTSLPPHANSAAFLEIENLGDEQIQLTGASTARAGITELHTMEVVEERMKMRRVDSFPIPPGTTLVLEPGSDHLMFFELDGEWTADSRIPITLHFEDGDDLKVEAPVRAL